MHGLTALAIIALVAALIRCTILAIFTAENFGYHHINTSHAFDLMKSFIQSIHVIEYSALLYGIGGFYLYISIKRNKYFTLNSHYKESCKRLMCRYSIIYFGAILFCGICIIIFALATITPVVLLTVWQTDIITAKFTYINISGLQLSNTYVGISYVSHVCHSLTRIFMIYVTVVVKHAWLPSQPRVYNSGTCLITCAKMVLRPKWLEDETEGDDDCEDQTDPKGQFTTLVDNYKMTGEFIAPLYAIFQQWFVMQWVVYFIKIIEDLSIALHSLVTETYSASSAEQHKLLFTLIHLVFDLILFLIPYFCASLFNQYHDEHRERLQKVQSKIFSKEAEGWMLQCAQLIPENPKYIFVPSFCGLSIPLSSPGYNLSIILALFAFIISVMTAL